MIRNYSHYSLLLGLSKPHEIVEKAKELGSDYVGLVDQNTLAGVVKFIKACKKEGMKPVIGMELKTPKGSIVLLCKNKSAWTELLSLLSKVDEIDLDDLKVNGDNFICIDGYIGSYLFKSCYSDEIYTNQIEPISQDLIKNKILWFVDSSGELYKEECLFHDRLEKMISLFKHYYIEESIENEICPIGSIWNTVLGQNVQSTIKTPVTYYIAREDSIDHRIILCSRLKTTIKHLHEEILKQEPELIKFLASSSYHLQPCMKPEYVDLIEEFEILSSPKLPRFDCKSEIELLKDLCRKGWREKVKIDDPAKFEVYRNRIRYELQVIEDANLAGYFLIVQDYANYMKSRGCLTGARGSAAGCFISYLLGITNEDPILYGLLFERFFSAERKNSLPDIDMDFPPNRREEVIEYLKMKYGESKVCQMVTYGRLQGKSAITEVLRANDSCSFEEIKKITKHFPNEAAISDLLEQMEDPSIIMWTLENHAAEMIDYCWIEDGKLQGQYAKDFEQAIRIEGTFKSQGKHAAGVIISSDVLSTYVPMIKSTKGEILAGLEMADLEAIGCVKMDILGLSLLKKIQDTVNDINFGDPSEHL